MVEWALETPVAFILYRRPELTARVWERIRQAQPRRLFLIADGGSSEEDWEACRAAREVVADVDWPCEVTRDYADTNLGCRQRVFTGLDAVFDAATEAIILEDDCLPDMSFFSYCDKLLAHYRDNERVMTISGNNFQNGVTFGTTSYYPSAHAHIWGWATWRRAWRHCDQEMAGWPAFRDSGKMLDYFQTPEQVAYWTRILDRAHAGEWAWAHRWWFSQLAAGGLGLIPQRNLVANIGFGPQATHTQEEQAAPTTVAMTFPLCHPENLTPNQCADERYFRQLGGKELAKNSLLAQVKAVLHPLLSVPGVDRAAGTIRKSEVYKRVRSPAYRRFEAERRRLEAETTPPHPHRTSSLLHPEVHYTDGPTLSTLYREIFETELYYFETTKVAPHIIDGGANIGLATRYWKQLYPNARIDCFEPDPQTLRCLRANCGDLDGVTIHGEALGATDSMAKFATRGGAAGRLTDESGDATCDVVLRRLRPLLKAPVDFLKLDVEGAEREILRDCADALGNVSHLYVEYHSFVDHPQELGELVGILEAAGFRLLVESNLNRIRPLASPRNWGGIDMALHLFGSRS